MKLKSLFFFLLILVIACQHEIIIQTCSYTQATKAGCGTDSFNTYHFILPRDHKKTIPLLLVLDSGGDGLFAIEKIKPAVSGIPCVVIGSDRIRNNYPDYERDIGVLISEACRKFPVSKDEVFLAGFSGGARMALEYARLHPVRGVLMCGAGPASFQGLPCNVYMIGGTTDFNFSEMYYNPLQKSGPQNFIADYFRGTHEWPPPEALKDGLLFLMGESIPDLQAFRRHESAILSLRADSLLDKQEVLFGIKAAEKSLRFDLHNKEARAMMKDLKKNGKIAGALRKIETDLDSENQIKQSFARASLVKDSVWWANTLDQLSHEIAGSAGEMKDHYLRTKGFLGILFYSRLNNMIHDRSGNDRIVHLLAAYRMAEPKNPDVFYYLALYASNQGDEKTAIQHLNHAFSLGFKDREKMNREFPKDMLNFIK
jgi:pimeloyl-ACP methyl ester carboxylesterase